MSTKQYIRALKARTIDSHPELPIDPDAEIPGRWRWPPHFQPIHIVLVCIGGCGGAYARYLVTRALPPTHSGWPLATLFVNFVGAFTLGLLLESLARLGKDQGARRVMRLTIGTGFIGAFTTYSTFALDTYRLLNHNSTMAYAYIIVMLTIGTALSALGIYIASMHHTRRQTRS